MKEATEQYIYPMQRRAIALSRFIRTLDRFGMMQKDLKIIDPHYMHKMWTYTKKWGDQ